jgi:hypothetical protein
MLLSPADLLLVVPLASHGFEQVRAVERALKLAPTGIAERFVPPGPAILRGGCPYSRPAVQSTVL